MSVIKLTYLTMVVVLLACAALFGQSAPPVSSPQTFHIQGTVHVLSDSAASGAEVTFEGEKTTKTVLTDKKGFYEANLPVGLYTMNVSSLKHGFKEYRRPLFRVASSTNLTLDATVSSGVSCDPVVPEESKHAPTQDEAQDACGGLDLFAVPSEDGVPFQLFIDYPGRQRSDQGNVYGNKKLEGFKTPVFVAYNLFTLQADDVVYDVSGRVLKATGNVVVENADGATQRADSITLKIENGQATPLLQPAHAQYPTDQYRPAGFVNDFAGMIDAKERAQLELICRDLDKTKRTQMAIVTIVSLEGLSAKEFATDLANRWGVGNKDNNRGVLILLAQRERQYRLAVGHGLESVLTDEEADRLMREIIPALKKGEFGNALVQVAERIRDEIEKKVP
jgi:hypothetical protein